MGTLLAIFIVQNMAAVEVQFLFWSFETRRFVILTLFFAAGLLAGRVFWRRRPHPIAATPRKGSP